MPESFYEICSHPELWGDVRINETAYIACRKMAVSMQKIRNERQRKKTRGQHALMKKGILKTGLPASPFLTLKKV